MMSKEATARSAISAERAMKLALEALEYIDRQDNDRDFLSPEECCDLDDAITAIREALAEQPAQQQEPVAWATQMGEYAHIKWGAKRPEYPIPYEVPLYTTPPQRKPLTDDELYKVFPAIATYHEANKTLYRSIARSIEAAHGIIGEQK